MPGTHSTTKLHPTPELELLRFISSLKQQDLRVLLNGFTLKVFCFHVEKISVGCILLLSLFFIFCLFQEFEVIAQIKLLQSACNSYCMTPDQKFIQWFQRQQLLTEEERQGWSVCHLSGRNWGSGKMTEEARTLLGHLFSGSWVAVLGSWVLGFQREAEWTGLVNGLLILPCHSSLKT